MAGRRRALIVANGEYDNAGLQRLSSPAADADALAEVLADRAISDFEVHVVRNETAHAVQAEIEDLCVDGRPDDVLLLHFSCHGLKDDSGGLYFAARNTRPDRLRSTAVPAQFVQQCIRQSRSRSIVLLLDCCYGGAFGQGVAVRSSGEANVLDSFRGGRGRAVITASNSIEYAFEGARLAEGQPAQPSVFTAALVEGLRTGEADRDEDGWIALGELYEYLFDRVRERNPKQTPSRDIEMQGELYLAKSRRRRIKPSPIPADLEAAIAAENPFTRLGAVAELRRRLGSDTLPVALGAFEALKTMASTDIQHVAAAASAAQSEVTVRADPPEVRFTGEGVTRRIRLLGPPVARACTFEASPGWIAVREVPDGAEVTVTPGPEPRRGRVVVTGPTGETVVAVEAAATQPHVPEPAAATAEPETAQPEPGPRAHRPVASERSAAALLGLLAAAGGLMMPASLAFEYQYNVGDYSYTLAGALPGLEWYVWPLALVAIVAGGSVAASGAGWAAGVAGAALWGLVMAYATGRSLTAESDHHLGAGFGFLFAGLLAVFAAGVGTGWLARRELGFRRPDRYSWAAIGLGLIGGAGLLVQYAADSGRGESGIGGHFAFTVVLAIGLPVLAGTLRPRRFGGQVAIGWSTAALAIAVAIARSEPGDANFTGLAVFGIALVLGVVAGGLILRNQPIGRQSVSGRPGTAGVPRRS
jgi:hypothetical protein